MEERILQIIKGEDSKNPLTDEEIASRLQVFREDVTTVRREHHIPDSRKRRKPVIFEDMKRILTEHPDVSDRGLTRMLEEAGYRIGKYARQAAGGTVGDMDSFWRLPGEGGSRSGTGFSETYGICKTYGIQLVLHTHIQSALDLGVPLPLITESVFARYISTYKDERVKASKVLSGPAVNFSGDKKEVIEKIRKALYFSKIMSYAQGFAQLRKASEEFDWDLPYGTIAQIWRAGCIIRAEFLQHITDAFDKDSELENLLLDDYFVDITKRYQEAVRDVVSLAVQAGIPIPTFTSAISYYDSYRSENLPANLIQAQRDYFGAHTYERTDKAGIFHYDWYTED